MRKGRIVKLHLGCTKTLCGSCEWVSGWEDNCCLFDEPLPLTPKGRAKRVEACKRVDIGEWVGRPNE